MAEHSETAFDNAAGKQAQNNRIQETPAKIRRPELLAPAGNYDCFLAAVHAGADAVYLAGKKFGARAAADNFDESELISAIRYAHIFDRKVYLTVNTLLKDEELDGLTAYLKPFVDEGLDAVIVQDFGVLSVIRREFPALAVHCSTQMTITDEWGIRLAEELGASRVVPARELTLSEIRRMKETCPDMELECFIHGAMCYSYSGQCLMSSLIGGRSGNRGACAQPCRLPYDVELSENLAYLKQSAKQTGITKNGHRGDIVFKEAYPLSLKDLCTVQLIPELIEAGIDSFKIEGRMKKPEYCAGVTAVYRAVMDRFFKDGEAAQGVTKKELTLLRGLYVRSEIGEGYYRSPIGKQMLTHDKPGYRGCKEDILAMLRERYLDRSPANPVTMTLKLKAGAAACLTVRNGKTEVTCTGDIVQEAAKKPLTEEELKERLAKTGGTPFEAKEIRILMTGSVFLPVGRLNELRREALLRMEEALLVRHDDEQRAKEKRQASVQTLSLVRAIKKERGHLAGVLTKEQFAVCAAHPFVQGICAPVEVYEAFRKQGGHVEKACYLSLPRILRGKDMQGLEGRIRALIKEGAPVSGIYVHTAGEYRYAVALAEIFNREPQEFLFGSPFLYCMNTETARFWQNRMCALSLPYELSEREIYALLKRAGQAGVSGLEMPVYGHIPMMITANCIMRSFDQKNCPNQGKQIRLKDRTGKRMYVRTECGYCLNTIYNSVPLSMHKHMQKLQKLYDDGMLGALAWNFTIESTEQTKDVLDRYLNADTDAWTIGTYTNGHFQRGVV